MRFWLATLLVVLMAGPGAAPATAQQTLVPGVPQSPILTIESDRFFAESLFGRRIAAEIEATGAELAAENRQIEAELTVEERALTEQRASLPADAFRALADAFDEKVTRLRREQDTKARALGQRSEDTRRRFLNAAGPVLGALMRESGAAVILERRAVFLSADVIDITDEAIRRVDTVIGDGSDLPDGDE